MSVVGNQALIDKYQDIDDLNEQPLCEIIKHDDYVITKIGIGFD